MVDEAVGFVNTPAYGKNRAMKKRRTYSRAGALKAEDWVGAARAALAEGGVEAVAIEPLARRLGVTKGSFYWHFKDRRALLEATLRRWEKESTEARISASRRISDPRERLIRLGEEVFGDVSLDGDEPGKVPLDRGVELAISDAADDAIVRPFLRRVTEQRIGYLEECFRELGLPAEEAWYRALLIYVAHAGTVRLLRDAPDLMPRGKDYEAYRRHLLSTLTPEDGTG
jgi:AcrR family transcriptional regulator